MVAALFIAAALSVGSAGTCDFTAAQSVVNDVNQHRTEGRVKPLAIDPQLTAVALDRAADLVRRHYFAHVSPDGTTAIDALHGRAFAFAFAGENLAEAQTVAAADAALWASPGHRENIMEEHYRRIGVAVLVAPEGGMLVVQIYSD